MVLSKVEYSNDYKVIGKVCDQVRIMAYDQAGDDRQLVNQNTSNGDSYKPVADINWVEKINLRSNFTSTIFSSIILCRLANMVMSPSARR